MLGVREFTSNNTESFSPVSLTHLVLLVSLNVHSNQVMYLVRSFHILRLASS